MKYVSIDIETTSINGVVTHKVLEDVIDVINVIKKYYKK